MPDLFEQIMSQADNATGSYLDKAMQEALGELYAPVSLLRDINHQNAIQARVPFVLNLR